MAVIVWHRRDLRVHDNRALYEAYKDSQKELIPVFVVDPFFFREAKETNNDRIEFMFECLEDLNRQYQEIGSTLSILFGDTLEVLQELSQRYHAKVFFNCDTNMPFGFVRDKKAQELGFIGFDNDAIERKGRKKEWHVQCKKYFMSQEYPIPDSLMSNPVKSSITFDELRKKYSIKKEKVAVPLGGTKEAIQRLEEFKKILPQYTKSISKPLLAEQGTSRLSAHLSFGAISLRRVYQEINALSYRQKNFFLTRLFWNQHFTQKLQDNQIIVDKAANPFFETCYDTLYEYDEEKILAWKQGRTGYPLVDASMRALVKTGFLNFRMRAMVASFFCYILAQPWKVGADFMHFHLIDADTAINYAQWQMQAGVVGVHPNRIYNPTKQILDNDPDCLFIKKYVSELKSASSSFIMQDPELRQRNLLGEEYIKPVVSFKEASKKARETYSLVNKRAYALVQADPELRKKLSLSRRVKKRVDDKKLPETKEV